MNRIIIACIALTFLKSCEKEFSFENECHLIGEEYTSLNLNNSNFIITGGKDYLYNSRNDLFVIKEYNYDNSGQKYNFKTTDSIIYDRGLPSDVYFFDSESQKYHHEKITYKGTNISNIEFWEYDSDKMNNLKHHGNRYLEYNNENLLIKIKEIKSYTYTNSINLSVFYYEDSNLHEIERTNWSERFPEDPYFDQHKSDTLREVLSFSDYDSLVNPYRGLVYLSNYRIKSLSKNNCRDYSYVQYSADSSIYLASRSTYVIDLYNDNNYPLKIGWKELIYDCN